jgi:uncharacterized membrane protein SirB2
MDNHELLNIIHAGAAALVVMVFLGRAILLWILGEPQNMASTIRGILVGLQHLFVTVLIITGVILLINKHFDVQAWFFAKIILFLVALSAMHKAFGKREIALSQRKAGVIIACFAFIGLVGLIAFKPNLGHHATVPAPSSSPVAMTNSKPV